jgi:hypothetical protein
MWKNPGSNPVAVLRSFALFVDRIARIFFGIFSNRLTRAAPLDYRRF